MAINVVTLSTNKSMKNSAEHRLYTDELSSDFSSLSEIIKKERSFSKNNPGTFDYILNNKNIIPYDKINLSESDYNSVTDSSEIISSEYTDMNYHPRNNSRLWHGENSLISYNNISSEDSSQEKSGRYSSVESWDHNNSKYSSKTPGSEMSIGNDISSKLSGANDISSKLSGANDISSKLSRVNDISSKSSRVNDISSKLSSVDETSGELLVNDISSKLSSVDETSGELSLVNNTTYELMSDDGMESKLESDEGMGLAVKSHIDSDKYERRRNIKTRKMRIVLANKYGNNDIMLRPMSFTDNYVNAYRKGLLHDTNGFVDNDMMERLLNAIKRRDSDLLSHVGNKVRLINPSAAWSSDLIGGYNNTYRYSRVPSLNSDIIAFDMTELYCMSMVRDIPFRQYRKDQIIRECCEYLNSLELNVRRGETNKIDPYNIFRGPLDLPGPYISQFLYKDVMMGGFPQIQKYPTYPSGYDFMKTWSTAISAQNGDIVESLPFHRNNPRYIISGRDLACYVHRNEPFQTFHNTCVILMDMSIPMNPGIKELTAEKYFINFGKPDIQSAISVIGRNALLATWYVKWNTMFLRPEALAIEIERIFMDKNNKYNISPELLRNPVLNAIRSQNGNVLLSQVYPEGSPLHPSTPSDQAAVAGACVTVLKFFFDTSCEVNIYEPDIDGQNIIDTGKLSTVDDELNKLALNIGFGSNWAGVHYRMDILRGMKLGQSVAISCLNDLIHRYPLNVEISFRKFNGKSVTIKSR